MNKSNKGFTLIELLAVITLVGILATLAVPNIISSINNSRKNTFLLDAKRMVTKAEYLISQDRVVRNGIISGTSKTYTYKELNVNDEFTTDADGGPFNDETFVNVSYNGTEFNYCICVMGSSKQITGTSDGCNHLETTNGVGCISSTSLTGIDIIKDIKKENDD